MWIILILLFCGGWNNNDGCGCGGGNGFFNNGNGCGCDALICNIFLNTLWLSMMSGKAMMVLLPMRVLKNLIKWPVDAALFYLIAKRMESLGLVRMIRKFQAE